MDIKKLHINKESNITISEQIAVFIKENIRNGKISAGDKLPTEREFSESIDVSRGTIKNSYKKLELEGVIETIQGSGSYIRASEGDIESAKKAKVENLISQTTEQILDLGYDKEKILEMTKQYLYGGSKKKLSIVIIHDTQEFLLDLKKQLAHIKNTSVSVFILENVLSDKYPEKLLEHYDLIIVPSEFYNTIENLLPNRKDNIIEASVSVSIKTIVEIATSPKEVRIGVISRTNSFLYKVKESLLSFGFEDENILSFFEMDYTVETYFPGGINILISFSDAHIFSESKFEKRNEELVEKGGKIIQYRYEMEQGTVIYIENKIKNLLGKEG